MARRWVVAGHLFGVAPFEATAEHRALAAGFAADVFGGVLEMSPVGPFISFDPSDDAHVAEVFRRMMSDVTEDSGPLVDWPPDVTPEGAVN